MQKKNCTIAQCQCVSWKKISAAVILISPGNFVSKCQKSSFQKKTFFPFKILIYILCSMKKLLFFHFFKVDSFVKNGSWWNTKLILVFSRKNKFWCKPWNFYLWPNLLNNFSCFPTSTLKDLKEYDYFGGLGNYLLKWNSILQILLMLPRHICLFGHRVAR